MTRIIYLNIKINKIKMIISFNLKKKILIKINIKVIKKNLKIFKTLKQAH